MDARQSLKLILKEFFEQELERKEIPFFIGGSHRFGYENMRSDIDIFIFSRSADIHMILLDLGLKITQHSDEYNNAETWGLSNLIHIIRHNDLKKFEELKEEHLQIERRFKENETFIKIAKSMKGRLISGKDIYQIFKKAFIE